MTVYQSPVSPESPFPTHDMPMRHVFIIVGEETLFLCHMINLWLEGHNWELALRVSLEEKAKKALEKRKGDTLFLANPRQQCFTLPGLIKESLLQPGRHQFVADIWEGMGTGRKPDHPDHHWLPWDDDTPLVAKTPVTVEAVVHKRHANLNETGQRFEQYFLFGAGQEAHIYHLPTLEPDYDHVATLEGSPPWLKPEQVDTGITVSIPSLAWMPDKTYCNNPLPVNERIPVLFHGITQYRRKNWDDSNGPIVTVPTYEIKLKRSWWFETRILNFFPPSGSQCI